MLTWPWTLLAPRRLAVKAEEAAYQRKQQESALLSRLAENVERLRAIAILSDLSADQLQRLAEICASSTYHASNTIFEQGDASDKFYIIVRGRFHVTAMGRSQL
jgi:CRP-like cAMP-binding protein